MLAKNFLNCVWAPRICQLLTQTIILLQGFIHFFVSGKREPFFKASIICTRDVLRLFEPAHRKVTLGAGFNIESFSPFTHTKKIFFSKPNTPESFKWRAAYTLLSCCLHTLSSRILFIKRRISSTKEY